jgi:hypothetical protein
MGSKTISSQVQISEVITEEGRIRLRGTVVFRPKGK